jgi:hypothetical protein
MQTQAQMAVRRGQDAAGDALRALLAELFNDEQPLRRMGALLSGADVRQPLPGPEDHHLTGTFAPDLTLHTRQGITSVAQLMHPGRPILLDLADRADLRATAAGWCQRVAVHIAHTPDRPADALLIRPDAHVAWAAALDEPGATATQALRAALECWIGPPPGPTDPSGSCQEGTTRSRPIPDRNRGSGSTC